MKQPDMSRNYCIVAYAPVGHAFEACCRVADQGAGGIEAVGKENSTSQYSRRFPKPGRLLTPQQGTSRLSCRLERSEWVALPLNPVNLRLPGIVTKQYRTVTDHHQGLK